MKTEQKNGFYPFVIHNPDRHANGRCLCVYVEEPSNRSQQEWNVVALRTFLENNTHLIGTPWITADNMTMGIEPVPAVRYSDFPGGIFDGITDGSYSNLAECYEKFHDVLNKRLNRDFKKQVYNFQPIDLIGLPAYAVRYFEAELHSYGHTPVYIFEVDGVKHYNICSKYDI